MEQLEEKDEVPSEDDVMTVHNVLHQIARGLLADVNQEKEESLSIPFVSEESRESDDAEEVDASQKDSVARRPQMTIQQKKDALRFRKMMNDRRSRANETPARAAERKLKAQKRWQRFKNDPEKLAERNRRRRERGKLNRREETDEEKELRRQREREKYRENRAGEGSTNRREVTEEEKELRRNRMRERYREKKKEREEKEKREGDGSGNVRELTEEEKELRRRKMRERYAEKKREREEREKREGVKRPPPKRATRRTAQQLTITETEEFAKTSFAKQMAFQRRKALRLVSEARGVEEEEGDERQWRVKREEEEGRERQWKVKREEEEGDERQRRVKREEGEGSERQRGVKREEDDSEGGECEMEERKEI